MEKPSLTIVPIRGRRDIDKVVPLFIEVFNEPPYNERWSEGTAGSRLLRFWANARNYAYFAQQGKRILGLIFCTKKMWDDGEHVIIEDIAVHKDFRNQGIGMMLADEVERMARSEGMAALDGSINSEAENALRFWKDRGFRPNGYVEVTKTL